MSSEEYEAIGRRLRNTRLHHRLSIREASQQLHIRAQYLEALENGTPEALPGLIYAKGYLQRYCAYLGLDEAELTEAFEQAGVFPQRRLFHFPEILNRAREPSRLLAWSSSSGAAIMLALWVAFAPKPMKLNALIPLPVSQQVLELLPKPCREADAPGYPPCYWKRGRPSLIYKVF